MMPTAIRRLAIAVIIGAAAALGGDALLQLVLSLVRVRGGVAWWASVRWAEPAVWLVIGIMGWLAATPVGRRAADLVPAEESVALPASSALRLVGTVMLWWPVVRLSAEWIVLAAKLTLAGAWSDEGRVLLEPFYYSNLLTTNAPTMLAGLVLLALARHSPDS
jgi:hypothetical protein